MLLHLVIPLGGKQFMQGLHLIGLSQHAQRNKEQQESQQTHTEVITERCPFEVLPGFGCGTREFPQGNIVSASRKGVQKDMRIQRFVVFAMLLFCSALLVSAASIPAGTHVTVRLGSTISSGTAHAGETWQGTLARDVVVNGHTVAKSGSEVTGKVTNAKSSGRLHAPGQLTLRLTSVSGQPVSSTGYYRKGKSHTKSNVVKIGGGTAAGAVIGGLVGGGKGAAIGAAAGAGAGTGVAAATGKQEAVIPAETVMTFTVTGR